MTITLFSGSLLVESACIGSVFQSSDDPERKINTLWRTTWKYWP